MTKKQRTTCLMRRCKEPVSMGDYCQGHWEQFDQELRDEFPKETAQLEAGYRDVLACMERRDRHLAARRAVGKRPC